MATGMDDRDDTASASGRKCERWFAAATAPGREFVAIEHLERQSFSTFCPLEQVVRRHARKTIKTVSPVFRGYVFVRLDPAIARWRSINGTWGVRALITGADGPLPVRAGVVETLLASTDDAGILRFVDPLQPGMVVRLRNGPLADELGVIERLSGRDRVELLMRFLGGSVRVAVNRDAVCKVA